MTGDMFTTSCPSETLEHGVDVVLSVSYLRGVGLAQAVEAVEFAAGLAAREHAGLHVAAGEILQLVVDVQIPDAAVEAGRVDALRGQTQRGRHHLLRQTWTHTTSMHLSGDGPG